METGTILVRLGLVGADLARFGFGLVLMLCFLDVMRVYAAATAATATAAAGAMGHHDFLPPECNGMT